MLSRVWGVQMKMKKKYLNYTDNFYLKGRKRRNIHVDKNN